MKTALVTHADCLAHVTPPGMPERVARLEALLPALDGLDLIRREAPPAADRDMAAVHDSAYIEKVFTSLPASGFAGLDGEGAEAETFLSPGSGAAIRRAAGGAILAVDLVAGGTVQNAFVATRPPGHHALADRAMGFCVFGNVVIAAKRALDHHGIDRVAVIDFDVHHGNGTQALLWDEPRTLVVSSQQMPLWPGSGHPSESGAHNNIVNLPLAPGSDGTAMRHAYTTHAFPRLRAFRPELILISAGFDAHRADPLAQLEWVEGDYGWITREICSIADECGAGRVVSVLEGGYDLDALAASGKAHVRELAAAAGHG